MITLVAILLLIVLIFSLRWGIELSVADGKLGMRIIAAEIRLRIPKVWVDAWEKRRRERTSVGGDVTETIAGGFDTNSADWWRLASLFEWEDIQRINRARRRLFGTLQMKIRDVDLIVATPDPALTGFAFGVACAARYATGPGWWSGLAVDFERDIPGVALRVDLTVRPIAVIRAAITLVAAFPRKVLTQVIRLTRRSTHE